MSDRIEDAIRARDAANRARYVAWNGSPLPAPGVVNDDAGETCGALCKCVKKGACRIATEEQVRAGRIASAQKVIDDDRDARRGNPNVTLAYLLPDLFPPGLEGAQAAMKQRSATAYDRANVAAGRR